VTNFSQLYRKHSPAMSAAIARIVGEHAEVEDLLHDAWEKYWLTRHTFQGRCSLRTWLVTISMNVARSAMRRDRGQAASASGPVSEPAADYRVSLGDAGDSIKQLPAKSKTYLVLTAVEGIAPGQLADLFKVRRSSMHRRIFEARKALRASCV